MPHKSSSGKWKWGNIERSSKEDLRRTVYGIWQKNGGKGSFSEFWKTGKVTEGVEESGACGENAMGCNIPVHTAHR